MANTKLKQKPVVFNTLDPYQLKLMEHTEKYPNFSGYIKRLIQRDMEGGTGPMADPPAVGEEFPDVDAKGFV